MKSAIFKYRLDFEFEQTIQIPKNSEFLFMGIQFGQPVIWYKHNPLYEEKIKVTVVMRPTGEQDGLFPGEDYITTLFRESGTVWHFFFKH